MTTPPALQDLEGWPEGIVDRNGRDLEPGLLVRVLGYDGKRSHDGHVVDCRKVEADGTAWLAIWEDDRQLSPHNTMFLIRQDDENGEPRRYSGEENDDMAAKKKSGKKTSKASGAKRSRKAGPETAAANDAPPPEPTRKHARQSSLPGTTEPDIEELDDICAKFKDQDDAMHSAKAEANKLRGAIAVAMEKHERTLYEYANKRFVYEPGAPKLKVQTIKDDED